LHFPENLGTLFNLPSVGPYDSCFDHQQINNDRVRHFVSKITDLASARAVLHDPGTRMEAVAKFRSDPLEDVSIISVI
jgi:hypothetical protein